MLSSLITTFITFFTVIDPIGTIPVFIAVTANNTKEQKLKIAKKAAIVSAGVLLSFVLIGEFVLNAIEVPLPIFQMAGGIILFLFALTMIFGDSKPKNEVDSIEANLDSAVFPLAMPSLASPGAILAAILLTDNTTNSIADQGIVILMILLVLAIAWVLMHYSTLLFKYIGMSGAAIISRIMGMILSSVALMHVLDGLGSYFDILP